MSRGDLTEAEWRKLERGVKQRARALNACILFLPQLAGTAVRTVEGIAGPDGGIAVQFQQGQRIPGRFGEDAVVGALVEMAGKRPGQQFPCGAVVEAAQPQFRKTREFGAVERRAGGEDHRDRVHGEPAGDERERL